MARRTQAERSAGTQQSLIDAAIALLLERGWAATTAVAVCERTGCTRGALIHHYPSLSALFAEALQSLYAELTRSAQRPTTMVALLDAVWHAVGDPRFKAVIEAWSAAGNDPELAVELAPAITRFAQLVAPDGPVLKGALRRPGAKAFFVMAREAMLGLALGRATGGGKPVAHERMVLTRLRVEAAAFDAGTTRNGGQ